MNHLTPEQLSALIDDVLPAAERTVIEAHLARCEACGAELEALRAADLLFAETAGHDPGDAYFESFAARVTDRIAAEESAVSPALANSLPPARPRREAAPWYDIGSWFRSPARLAWAGGVAAVVVTAGVTLMVVRESGVPDLRDAKHLERFRSDGHLGPRSEPAAPAPAGESADAESEELEGLSEKVAPDAISDRDERQKNAPESHAAAPARVREMKQVPGGEDVAVGRADVPGFARTPAAAPVPAPVQPGEPARITRQRRAEPLRSNETAPAKEQTAPAPATSADALLKAEKDDAAVQAKRAKSSLGSTGVRGGVADDLRPRLLLEAGTAAACGTVVDLKGRPIAKAQVVLGGGGVTTTTGEDGRFCFDVAAGEHDLTVLAVGFTPLRQRVALGDGAAARLVVQTVEVLQPPAAAGGAAPPRTLASKLSDVALAVPAGLPDGVEVLWREAVRLEGVAARGNTAPQQAAAAGAWNDVIARLAPGEARLDAREHHADALLRAWELGPDGIRAGAAATALRALIAEAPAGPRRDRAREKLARLLP